MLRIQAALLATGGTGFLMLYSEPSRHHDIRRALGFLRKTRFRCAGHAPAPFLYIDARARS
jgi:hypothetical protein